MAVWEEGPASTAQQLLLGRIWPSIVTSASVTPTSKESAVREYSLRTLLPIHRNVAEHDLNPHSKVYASGGELAHACYHTQLQAPGTDKTPTDKRKEVFQTCIKVQVEKDRCGRVTLKNILMGARQARVQYQSPQLKSRVT